MNVVGIEFKENGKVYCFESTISLNINDYVIVETEKGLQLGKVKYLDMKEKPDNIKSVVRKATESDYNVYLNNLKKAQIALKDIRKKVQSEGIPMRVIDATFTFDRKELLINFVSDERIDFRNLLKYLAAKYKAHIELHQIGVRDKAREIGGIGQCGLELCCRTFKKSIDGISINMAKEQNVSLNPNKINGCCGRLLCCLSYENKYYSDSRKILPNLNDEIDIDGEKYKVSDVNLLNRNVKAVKDNEEKIIEYD